MLADVYALLPFPAAPHAALAMVQCPVGPEPASQTSPSLPPMVQGLAAPEPWLLVPNLLPCCASWTDRAALSPLFQLFFSHVSRQVLTFLAASSLLQLPTDCPQSPHHCLRLFSSDLAVDVNVRCLHAI